MAREREEGGTLAPRFIALTGLVVLAGCDGRHSWLAGAGREARTIEQLFWPMLAGAALAWTIVIGLSLLAFRSRPAPESEARARAFVLWGGAVVPTLAVAALLVGGLLVLRSVTAGPGELRLHVDAEQWWWRVSYDGPDGAVVAANELRLPAGQRAEILLTSDDVIHSLWMPALGGKLDMIPGMENRLMLTPQAAGEWGGLCAEFCGIAHAQMRFAAVVMEPDAFRIWLEQQAQPAAVTEDPGLAVFLDYGCGACHAIRGTPAAGQVGPDLTHLAGRRTLAAGLLPMAEAELARWIRAPQEVKPGVRMPAYPDLEGEDLARLTGYLMRLQ